MHIFQSLYITVLLVLFKHNKTPKVFCLTFGVHVKFQGIAGTFAMFLHQMPDQVGHDRHCIVTSLPARLAICQIYHSRGHTELIFSHLNKSPYKFGIKIWLLADMNN